MIAWLEKRLVPDWRDWWKWASTWLAGFLTLVPAFWAAMDPAVLVAFGAELHPFVMVGLFVAWTGARLIQQKGADDEADDQA